MASRARGARPDQTKLFFVASPDDYHAVVLGYRLDPGRAFHEGDYERAVRRMYRARREGSQAHVITAGPDPRDLLRLRPPNRQPGADTVGDLKDDVMDPYEDQILLRTEPVPARLTWAALVKREPRLADLRAVVGAVVRDRQRHYNANGVWFGPHNVEGVPGLKYQMVRLVGRHALTDDPVIRSSDAYDVAYEALYGLLPPDFTDDEDDEY